MEWFEQGETKGKDIDLGVIESLNPDIRIVNPSELHESTLPTLNSNMHALQRVSSEGVLLLSTRHDTKTFCLVLINTQLTLNSR